MTRRRHWRLLAVGAAALTGCGGSEGFRPAVPPSSTSPSSTVAVEATLAPSTTAPARTRPANRYPPQPAGVPFPTEEWPTGEFPPSVDRSSVDAAVDAAFGAPDATSRVQAIVAVQGGRIVYGRYHPLDGPDTVFPSFSVAKSVTSALIGLLVSDGELALDGHPNVRQWRRPADPRREITVRDLLQMSSGLQWDEVYEAGADPLEMLQAPNAAAFVASQPLEFEPGTVFEYSTGTTALLAGIAADTLGGATRRSPISTAGSSIRSGSRPTGCCATRGAAGTAGSVPT
jgi:CubicO group peptidase (beta-lactamase class C family)